MTAHRALLVRIAAGFALGGAVAAAQAPPGQASYDQRCTLCHGGDASGTDRAPSLFPFLAANSNEKLAAAIRQGVPAKGMPAFEIPEGELAVMMAFLRTMRPPKAAGATGPARTRLPLAAGGAVEGLLLNESGFDAQLRDADGRIRLFRREGDAWREAATGPNRDWPSYHGSDSGNRHSPLAQIDRSNVGRLAPRWFFPIPGLRMIEGTPVVLDGVMYVTAVNRVSALDAAAGREIWRWERPRTPGLIGDASIGINRGVAVRGDKVFTVTDNAHLVALDRTTGTLVWDVEMADSYDHYGATAAPLIVGDLVVAGMSGGDTGLRGFLDAYHAETGERAWRFWTIPAPGEPGSETWGDRDVLEKGCGATWLTGSYDPDLGLLYWPTGNPCPDLDGDRRPGDNLYTNSVVALDPATGKLRWYFQFTPHDTHDWDAQAPLVLVDEEFQGRRRKLLLQGNRNAFFYVLDRETGEFLLGEPFARQTWADGLDAEGRPAVRPESTPTAEGTATCPAIRGATNWFATAYHPGFKLFYLTVHEACNIYTKLDPGWQRGRGWLAGSFRLTDDSANRKHVRALDIRTGRVVWDYEQAGPAQTYSGVLATDGGLVFFGENSGAFAALDAETGRLLWHVQLNQDWKASPMTYMVDGRQYVAIASGMGFWAFALAE